METSPNRMIPTLPLVTERIKLINQIRASPVEIKLNILGQMEDTQLINVCLTDTEMLNLCFTPYLRLVKQWSNEDFLIFRLSLLFRCKYQYCQPLMDKVTQELAQYNKKDQVIFKLKALSTCPAKQCLEFKDQLNRDLAADSHFIQNLNVIIDGELDNRLVGDLATILTTTDKIDLSNIANVPVDLDYFVNLNNLDLSDRGSRFNQPIDLTRLTKLTELTVGPRYNQPLDKLPISLKILSVGDYFNQSIDLRYLVNLKQIKFGYDFNRPVNGLLPNGIKDVIFGEKFNQSIDNLPNSIVKISLSLYGNYNQRITTKYPNLEQLDLPYNYPYYDEVYKLMPNAVNPWRILKKSIPGLYNSGYKRLYGSRRLPRLLLPEEIQQYRLGTLTLGEGIGSDQVLPFPRENPKWFFAPRSKEFPFIGIAKNKLPNKNTYPYVPFTAGVKQLALSTKRDYILYRDM